MEELIEHLLVIEMQKTELKLNDYREYVDRLGEEDRVILEKIIKMLDDYLHELDKLKR